MSTAIYVKGVGVGNELLFSFGEGVDIEDIYEDVLSALADQGVGMVEGYMVTSSEHLHIDLLDMMQQVQQEVFGWDL